MRLDLYVKDELSVSRSKAQELIENGCVFVNGKSIVKPAFKIEDCDSLDIKNIEDVLKYVSRGGYKLEKAIIDFDINVRGKYCIDIGSSTGGFTDCLIKNGAKHVCCVDVGTSQLADELRLNGCVTVLENTDIRDVDFDRYGGADIITADVSFISLSKIMYKVSELLKSGGVAVLLVKPQFEAGQDYISSKGIVKNKKVHCKVIDNVVQSALKNDLGFKALTYSPIKGGNGNIEYLLYVQKGCTDVIKKHTAEAITVLAQEHFNR